MLVFTRKIREIIDVTTPSGERIEFFVEDIRRDKVRIGVTAPRSHRIDRREVTTLRERRAK